MTTTNIIGGGLIASFLLIFLCIFFHFETYNMDLKIDKNMVLEDNSSSVKSLTKEDKDNLLEPIVNKPISKPAVAVKKMMLDENKSEIERNTSLVLLNKKILKEKILILEEASILEEKNELNKENLQGIPTPPLQKVPLVIENKMETDVKEVQKRITEFLNIEQITFKKNSGIINRSGKEVLNKIVKLLINNKNISIEVQGHTDAGGKMNINQQISLMRAERVAKYLTSQGLIGKNIRALGFGESVLLFSDKPYSRLNRRVEIYIKRK